MKTGENVANQKFEQILGRNYLFPTRKFPSFFPDKFDNREVLSPINFSLFKLRNKNCYGILFSI